MTENCYCCPHCSIMLATRHDLDRHIETEHEKTMHKHHVDSLIAARGALETKLELYEKLADWEDEAAVKAEELRGQIQSLRWTERVVRAAAVVVEERTPEGVSDTLIDELAKAVGS